MLFSIGYATKPLAQFISQLDERGIQAVADVRSVPYSKAFAEFRQAPLRQILAGAGVRYVYLGKELGPRSDDPAHYDSAQQVQYGRLMSSAGFEQGIARLQRGLAQGYRIAMLCAEKDPANCHRSLLIGYYLVHQQNLLVQHIHHDGAVETQADLENRLVREQGLSADLLSSADALASLAYERQCSRTSYRRED